MIYENFRSPTIALETLKMRDFPFTLQGEAQDWLYYLSLRITNRATMERIFLEKYFPTSRVAAVRGEIYGIRQRKGETLNEYWERFNKLYASCAQHQMKKHSLIQYFYEGMSLSNKQWADAASGGSFLDQMPQAGRELIERKATDGQQCETRANSVTSLRGVHEVETYAANEKEMDERIVGSEKKLDEIVSLFKTSTPKKAKVCGICTLTSHYTNECTRLT